MRIVSVIVAALCLGQAGLAAIVTPSVTSDGSTFTYQYTVQNNGPNAIIQFRLTLPVFPDEILLPDEWIPWVTDLGGTTLIEWNALFDGIAIGTSFDGFGITSQYPPGLVGFEVLYDDLTPEDGITEGPGGAPITMPEPATFGVVLAVLAGAAVFRVRAARRR